MFNIHHLFEGRRKQGKSNKNNQKIKIIIIKNNLGKNVFKYFKRRVNDRRACEYFLLIHQIPILVGVS